MGGKKKEDERLAECKDGEPGLCYNEDGAGTDTNREGSTNCCTQTCSSCSIKDSPTAQWKQCTALDADTKSASCGFLSRYDQESFQCDFEKCEEGDHWHTEGEAYNMAFTSVPSEEAPSTPDPSEEAPSDPSGASVLQANFVILLIHFVFMWRFRDVCSWFIRVSLFKCPH